MKKANPFAKKGGFAPPAMDDKAGKKGDKKGFVPFQKGGKKSARGK